MVTSSDLQSRISSILTNTEMNLVAGNNSIAIANLMEANRLSRGLDQDDAIFNRFHRVVMRLPVDVRQGFFNTAKRHNAIRLKANAGMTQGLSDDPGDLAWDQGYMGDDPQTANQAIASSTGTTDTGSSVPTTVAPPINVSLDTLRASCSIKDAALDTWNGLGLPGKALVVAGGYLLIAKCLLR